MGFFKDLIKSVLKVSRPIFTFEENELRFKISSDNFYTYYLDNFDIKTRHDPYILDAYTLKTPELLVEYIQIDSDSSWQGDALGFYVYFLQQQCKFKEFKLLEKKEYKHYEFRIYEIDEELTLHLIYIWDVDKDIFILDHSAELYKTLVSKLDNTYQYKYEDKTKINFDFNSSLVKENAFKNYIGAAD